MEFIRTTDTGDVMYPHTITIYAENGDVKTGWSNPVIEMKHKVVDSRNGRVTTPDDIGFDKITIGEAVALGVWTAEEAQIMIGLCLKLYCRAGDPVVETPVVEVPDGN